MFCSDILIKEIEKRNETNWLVDSHLRKMALEKFSLPINDDPIW